MEEALELMHKLVILSLAMNVVLMFAFAYLLATRNNGGGQNLKLEADVKKLSNDLKLLDRKLNDMRPPKVVDTLPEIAPFGMSGGGVSNANTAAAAPAPSSSEAGVAIDSAEWSKFVEEFNLLAGSMDVPKKLQACEKFVKDHKARLLVYSGMMNFMGTNDVDESNYWAWKISESNNIYAVVPNPAHPCDNDTYERGGLNTIFEMEYKGGTYTKYVVEIPAIFTANEADVWKLENIGRLDVKR